MKKRAMWVMFSIVLVLVMILTSCATTTTTTAPTTTTPTTTAPTTVKPTTTTPTTTAPTTTAPTAAGNWWDKKWGQPKYGGSLTMRAGFMDIICDPQDPRSTQWGGWMEVLFGPNATTDRSEYAFQGQFVPAKYMQPWVAESYVITSPTVVTVQIRKGIHWQAKPPTSSGREVTAADVQYSYDHILSTGTFVGQPMTMDQAALSPGLNTIKEVVATGPYTVEFHLKAPSAMAIYQILEPNLNIPIVPHEYYDLSAAAQVDWHNVIGCGAFFLSDYVRSVSLTMTANPLYYGTDERYTGKVLPYLDTIRAIVIPDMATSIAALRTGKLDFLADAREHASLAQAQSIAKTNPDIQQFMWPASGMGVTYKWGAAPFTDIKVRKALQYAINNTEIAKDYYLGTVNGKPSGLVAAVSGTDWASPYDQWPSDIKAEYTYDLDKAKDLLEEAGFPNGFTTSAICSTSDDLVLLQVLKSYFAEIGVTVNIDSRDMMTERNLVNGGQYDGMCYATVNSFASPPSDVIQSFYSKKLERIGGGGGVVDAAYDAMVDKLLAATTEADAQAILKEAELYALRQHWTAMTVPSFTPQFLQGWIKGFCGEMRWNVMGWKYMSRIWSTRK